MEQNVEFKARQPRRKFLAVFLATVAGTAAWLLAPKRACATGGKSAASGTGPILYQRTKEAERYYKTLYR